MKLKIGTKISLGFLSMLVLLLILAGNAYISLMDSNESMERIDLASQRVIYAMKIESEYTGAIAAVRGYVAYGDEKYHNQTVEKLANVLKLEKELLKIARPEKKKDVEKLIDDTQKYTELITGKLLPLVREQFKAKASGNASRTQQLHEEVQDVARGIVPFAESIMKFLGEAAANNTELINKDLSDSISESASDKGIAMGIGLAAIIISVILSYFMTRMIKRPITEMLAVTASLAKGDLRATASVKSSDEIGELAQSINVMRDNFILMIAEISKASEYVASSSEELTASAEESAKAVSQVAMVITEVAQGSDMQSEAAKRTSGIVGQMVEGIKRVASNAGSVADQADKTNTAAISGGTAVASAVEQMESIKTTVASSARVVWLLGDRSKEIGQIVDTISGIAGQTNLLALNAAIEAARAGEQGRGFAVVAEEVRKLAEQSQDAAKRIAELISSIQSETDRAVNAMNKGTQEVAAGADVVNSLGSTFHAITKQISEVSAQMREIDSAIQNISLGSQQVVKAIHDIEDISKDVAGQTQTVSAATEEQSASMQEIAASSQSLAKMAEDLQIAVSKFRV